MNEDFPFNLLITSNDLIQQKTPQGEIVESFVNPSVSSYTGRNYRIGSSMRDWKARIKLGQSATTYFSAGRQGAISTSGTVFSRRPNGPNWYECTTTGRYSPGAGLPDAINVDTTYADGQALIRIYRKLRKTKTRFQGGVFLGELSEAIRMIRRPAKALRDGVDKYFKTIDKRVRKVNNVPQLQKVIGDTYLEASFGWDPFIKDISDISKEIRRLGENDTRSRLSAFCMDENAFFDILEQMQSFGTDHPTRMNRMVKTYAYVRYILGKRVHVQALGVPRVMEQFGLVKAQLLPALWELRPWSFLIDYFTNIGDLVEATSTETEDVLWVNKTVRTGIKHIYISTLDLPRFYTDYPSGVIEGSPGITVFYSTAIVRSPLSTLPFPSFSLDLPGKARQWLNMAGLIASKTAASDTIYKTVERISRRSTSTKRAFGSAI